MRATAAVGTATAIAGIGVLTPAAAMESDMFAVPSPESNAVVSVRTQDSDAQEGVCTGVAVAPHWVLTARHCVEGFPKVEGSVRTGQGDNQRYYDVDRWEVAHKGDIAMLHTVEDMMLETYPKVSDAVPSVDGEVDIYGWSSDGSGGTTKLPTAKGNVDKETPMALFGGDKALEVSLKDGAKIQPGDSGGPIFTDKAVSGVMSAGLFSDPENPSEEELKANPRVNVTPIADQVGWINTLTSEKEVAPQDRMPQTGNETTDGEQPAGGFNPWWIAAGGAALAIIIGFLAYDAKRNSRRVAQAATKSESQAESIEVPKNETEA
ncbi:trypsin-like serine protease [Corynebacterium aquatimens]